MYRTLIYIATNFAIILVLFLIWLFVAYAANVYGWNLNIGWGPGDYAPLLVFCFIFGMGGSFLSLQISRGKPWGQVLPSYFLSEGRT